MVTIATWRLWTGGGREHNFGKSGWRTISNPFFWRDIGERTMTIIEIICCADCGKEGGVSLKACKSCMLVKYCNPTCQRNHWSKHKKQCKERAAELRDEALFKHPPAKEDCPICFLPMPDKNILCLTSTRD
jgi:hypothetical protein